MSSDPHALHSVDALAAQIATGDRRALARAVTLVESTRDDDRLWAEQLLERIQPQTGRALRVGISGTPGVGKSTFIEALGRRLIDVDNKSIAVLAVDPSSVVSGGSLLGDKTRMEWLSKSERAWVRPSPSSGALGGTAPHTRDAILVCEAAGFDVVLVETVGVGQSEAAVADLVDTFVLLVAPGGGDELQGTKRGILELVDVIVVNKADGERAQEAMRTRDDYAQGARLFLRPLAGWSVPVLTASGQEGSGIDDVWRAVLEHRALLDRTHARDARRAQQSERALWRAVDEALAADLRASPAVQAALSSTIASVRTGAVSPARAARELLRLARG
ncbi:MAG TPA: methylmalonyl Co-A mutase-associated GTPase MeaB [Myxococcota bacterium]|jgi:LAO/AO transport system kinase